MATFEGMTIYDETNADTLAGDVRVDGELVGRGLIARDFERQPLGSLGFAKPFDLPLIPRSEWAGRIEEQDATRSSLHHLRLTLNVPVKNQKKTNYCWINAPVCCVETVRAVQGNQYVELSPASCGALIKGYRDVGGWGTEGIKFIVSHGIAPVSLWPANAIDSRYDTADVKRERQKYRISEWYELQPDNFEQLATCLLLNIPIAVGYNWWGHEVTAIRLVKPGRNTYGIVIANSWGGSWEDNGYGVLTEGKGTPDDAIGPRVVYSTGATA